MKNQIYLLIIALACLMLKASANNIQVSNATCTGQNIGSQYTMVRFDLTWENSWRNSSGPKNFDAAYVFVKYRVTTTGDWKHATLSSNAGDHSIGYENVPMTILPSATAAGTPDNDAVYFYRTGDGSGNDTLLNVLLRWNYGTDGVADGDAVQIRVYALEMVYIPQGPFYIGDGSNILTPSSNAFRANAAAAPNTNYMPWKITTEAAIVFTSSSYTGSDKVYDPARANGYTLAATFPKGYDAFFIMKYEMSQEQYLDFFNTLPYLTTPRSNRNITGGTRNAFSWPGGPLDDATVATGKDRACNNLYYDDVLAYADWACMRPMSELEYEKASRGTDLTSTPTAIFPVNLEYSWGNTSATQCAAISNDGAYNEIFNTCGNFSSSTLYPFRCGIFSAKTGCGTSVREFSGSTYYGVMEMTGNLYEIVYGTWNTYNGIAGVLTTANGNGALSSSGATDNVGTAWTNYTYYTYNMKGGYGHVPRAVSYRAPTSYPSSRNASYGFRTVRSAPNGL